MIKRFFKKPAPVLLKPKVEFPAILLGNRHEQYRLAVQTDDQVRVSKLEVARAK